eukprot:CAMPEP_0114343664 /NCGR_PEP_ID=MMETSP0101-20121206/10793_1 /TAXON_ID=38822 ORGANISM="Pteridomonas danica, Strain PT" /NCGR_SAMPLE_ID=MMETSP0101 /ASSEMBLY_ACC=CAM_ASM_000211 /LENGTH=497 /DNA_ID=CAMNT_0001478533 /DNA_START=51 /DNA_END=1544 /DNA_ORIENTATION=+
MTGADADTALSYLEMSGGVVEQALNLFLEMGGSSSSNPSNPINNQTNTGSDNAFNDHNFNDHAPPSSLVDQVRAPDSTKRLKLIDHQANINYGLPEQKTQVHVFRDFNREAQTAYSKGLPMSATIQSNKNENTSINQNNGGKNGNNNGSKSSSSSSSSSSSNTSSKSNKKNNKHIIALNDDGVIKDKVLSDLYRPPLEIIFNGSFADAKQHAKTESKWLVVNIQDDSVFESQLLNRDTWSNDTLQLLMESLCVFWQTYSTQPQGQTFIERYKVNKLPFIALVDPRTGMSVWKREGFVSAELLGDKISDYCSQHSVADDAIAVQSSQSNTSSLSSSLSSSSSLSASSSSSSSQNVPEPPVLSSSLSQPLSELATSPPEKKQPSVDSFEKEFESVEIGEEPVAGDKDSTRIAFQGKVGDKSIQFTRRFLKTDKISVLFACASKTLFEKIVAMSLSSLVDGKVFDISTSFQRVSLRKHISSNETIDEAGVCNSKLIMTLE